MAIATEVLLLNEDMYKAWTPLNGAVDPNLMRPHIILAQDKYLETYLGTDLYVKIKTDSAAGTIAGVYLTLLDTYIRKVILWWTMVEALPSLHVKVDNGTIAIRTSEDTTSISQTELQQFINKARDNAQMYTQKMVDYLCANSSSFPEYSSNTFPDKFPKTDVYGQSSNFAFSKGNSRFGGWQFDFPQSWVVKP